MQKRHDQLVTIIGSAYFQPVADLIVRLLSLPRPVNNDVQTSERENGYSVSLVLLLVAVLESYVMRVRYMNRKTVAISRKPAHAYLRCLYPDLPQIDLLKEIFVVRDIIAHNHLWEIDYALDENIGMTLIGAIKDPASGDFKYEQVVDVANKKTKPHGLNALPTKTGRVDVSKVFDGVWDTLLFLESKNRNQCYVSHLHVRIDGRSRVFGGLRNDLRNTL